jgi:hypothetical protein
MRARKIERKRRERNKETSKGRKTLSLCLTKQHAMKTYGGVEM